MTPLEISLSATCVLLLAVLSWAGYTLYKIGVTMLQVQDTLEESLEVIDERVESIEKILDIPLFSDSPEIKRLRKDMMLCRDAMLEVAYAMSSSMRQQKEDPDVESE